MKTASIKVLGIFYDPRTLDCYTFVTDSRDRQTGYYDMLATDEIGDDLYVGLDELSDKEK